MIPLLAALATAGAIVLFGWQLSRGRQSRPNERRLQRLNEAPEPPKKILSWDEVRRRGPSSLPLFRDGLLQSDWAKKMGLELEAAGLSLRTGEYLIIRGVFALAGLFGVLDFLF